MSALLREAVAEERQVWVERLAARMAIQCRKECDREVRLWSMLDSAANSSRTIGDDLFWKERLHRRIVKIACDGQVRIWMRYRRELLTTAAKW